MSKFANTAAKYTVPNTTNRAGGASHTIADSKKELASVVLASMLKGNSYYQSDESRIQHIFDLAKADPKFAAKAMIYARQEGNLRSVSHVLANAIAEAGTKDFSLRSAIRKAVVRPDDMIEMFALWKSRHTGMVPNAMRRAFKDLLESNKWDAYQLKKYARTGQNTKLRDVVLISHPKDNRGMLGKLIDGTLQAPKTMESMLSEGKKASATFDELLRENRLGYMAAVKNIRNALETGISDEALDLWAKMISDRNRVLRSRMLPFRFMDAWENVQDLPIDYFKLQKVKEAFNQALVHSAQNLGFIEMDDKVAIVIDESGSMSSDRGNGVPWKNAIILAAILHHALPKGNSVAYKFGDRCTKLDFGTLSPIDIITNTRHSGYATHFEAPLQELTRTATKVDKIVMLTDMQLYSGYGGSTDSFDRYWNHYKKAVSPKAKMLFWDLAGYGVSTPLSLRGDVLLAAGFSDKLLSVIPKMWKNENALVKEIEAIDL